MKTHKWKTLVGAPHRLVVRNIPYFVKTFFLYIIWIICLLTWYFVIFLFISLLKGSIKLFFSRIKFVWLTLYRIFLFSVATRMHCERRSRNRTGKEPLQNKDHVWCWWIDPNISAQNSMKSQSRYWSATISYIKKDINGQIMYYAVHYADKSR